MNPVNWQIFLTFDIFVVMLFITGLYCVLVTRNLIRVLIGLELLTKAVTFDKIIYQPAPARFEAGTGNIADAVGLGAALEYVSKIGIDNIARYEHELLVYAMEALRSISGLRLIGTAAEKTSVLSFVLAGHSNQDIGVALNRVGIAVRTGHHCAQPILRRFGLESTVRPSLAFYNTHDEVDLLVTTVRRIQSGKDF